MSSRELWVKILANVSGFQAGIASAQNSLTGFDKSLQQSAEKRDAINKLGNAFGVVGLAAAGAAAIAVKSFADFDSAMSAVKATGDDAAGSIDKLRQAALDAGAETAFSATESAAAIENLAKAGISAADILSGGLDGSLALAAAGGLDVASAAEIAAVAMTQFGLKGSEIPHVADLLAAAAGKANGEVTDMGQALGQAGLVAGQMGLSIEETTGVLAAFAQAGLLGSDAGTSFKSMLQRLANPSKESAELMKKFGIEAYNASGELVSMTELAGQLETAFVGQSQATRDAAMAQIFGSDAIRAANVLYSEGADGIANWTNEVNDAGYAAETAKTRMDNLKGDLEQLGGALETALIGTGEGANGPLRDLIQDVTKLVDAYNELPAPLKESTLRFLALTAALGGVGFVTSRAVTGFADMANFASNLSGKTDELTGKAVALSRTQLFARGGALVAGTALAAIQPAAAEANEAMGALTATAAGALVGTAILPGWGTALGAVAGAAYGVTTAFNSAEKAAEDAAETAEANWENLITTLGGVNAAITEATRAMAGQNLRETGLASDAKALGIELRSIIDVSLGVPGAVEAMDAAMAASGQSGSEAYQDLREELTGLRGDFRYTQFEARELNEASIDYATSLSSLPPEVVTSLEARNWDLTMEEIEALRAQYNLTPDEVDTLVFLDSQAALVGIDVVLAGMLGLDQTVANPLATLDATSAQGTLGQLFAGLLGLDAMAPTSDAYLNNQASGPISLITGQLNALDGKVVRTTVFTDYLRGQVQGGPQPGGGVLRADGGLIQKFAWGGFVSGPGGPREDKVPALLSDGEFVQRAAAVDKYGTKFMAALNEGRINPAALRAATPGYANGGSVGGHVTASVGDVTARLDPADLAAVVQGVGQIVLSGMGSKLSDYDYSRRFGDTYGG